MSYPLDSPTCSQPTQVCLIPLQPYACQCPSCQLLTIMLTLFSLPTHRFHPHRSTFKCCTPDDAPDACLAKYNHNDTRYDYYDSYKPYYETPAEEENMFDSIITQSTPVSCKWTHVAAMCPKHMMETCLGVGNMTW